MHVLCRVILSKPAPADHQVHPETDQTSHYWGSWLAERGLDWTPWSSADGCVTLGELRLLVYRWQW